VTAYLIPPIAPSTEGGGAPAAGSAVSFMAEKTFSKDEDAQKYHTSVSVYNESESYPALFFQCFSRRAAAIPITWVAVSGTSVTPLYNAAVCADPIGWVYFVFQYQVPANVDKIQTSMNFAASVAGFGADIEGVFSSWKLRSATPEITLRSSIGAITGASAGQDFTVNVCVNVPASTESVVWLISERGASAGAIPVSVQDTVKRTDNNPALGNMFHLQATNADRTAFSVSSTPNVNAANNREVALFSWQVSCA